MNPSDIAINDLLTDDEYASRNADRDRQLQLDRMREAGERVAVDTTADPISQMQEAARKARAASIVHRMELAAKAGPDAIAKRIQHFEQTGDPSGERPVGIAPAQRADRLRAIASDDRMLSFFERHPEAALLAADDDSLLQQGGKILGWLAERGRAPLTGARRDWIAGQIANIDFELGERNAEALIRGGQLDSAPDVQEMLARRAHLRELQASLPHVGLPGDRNLLDTFGERSGNFTQILDEGLAGIGQIGSFFAQGAIGGARAAKNTVPLAFVAGAAAGAPGGPAVATTTGTTAALAVLPYSYTIGFWSAMSKREIGSRLTELYDEGWRKDDPATYANAIVYGVSSSMIERASLGFQWGVAGKKIFSGAFPGAAKALGVRAGNWVRSPGITARFAELIARGGAAAVSEGFEEILQGTFSKALGTEVGRQAQGRPVEEVWEESLRVLEQNFPQALEEGARAALSVALLGGLSAPMSVYRINKQTQIEQQEQEFFDQLEDVAGTSKLAERSPRLAGEFVGLITEGTDRSHIYIEPDLFADALNSEGISEIEANTVMPGIVEKIDEARKDGRKLAIPSKDFARSIVNTNMFPRLREHITTSPTALTRAERQEALKQTLEDAGLDELATDKENILAVQTALDESATEVGLKIAEQLVASGQRTKEVAEIEGQAVAARVRALAAQISVGTGRLYTPQEVFDLYPLNVVSKDQMQAIQQGRAETEVLQDAQQPTSPELTPEVTDVPEAPGEELPSTLREDELPDEGQILDQSKKPKQTREERLLNEVPGLSRVMTWLNEKERKRLQKDTATELVRVFGELPSIREVQAAALAGQVKKGWYRRSAKAIVQIFGITDAPRFSALLASFSPRTSVESNLINALGVWANWIKAGRPTDRNQLIEIFGKSVQGEKGVESVLGAWIPNAVLSLTAEDPSSIELSGEKVDSFMNNLREDVNRVTIDAWEALLLGIPDANKVGLVPNYLAGSALIRKAAAGLTKLTGQLWTPEEVQETTWSWAKALVEKEGAAGETRTLAEIVQQEALTEAEIAGTPDFANLFAEGVYRKLVQEAGLDPDAAASSRGGDGRDGVRTAPEDLGLSRDRFQAALVRAARRIDRTKQARADLGRERKLAKRARQREQVFQRTADFVRRLRSDRADGQSGQRAFTRQSAKDGRVSWRLTKEAKQLLQDWNADWKTDYVESTPEDFRAAIERSTQANPFGASVEIKSIEEYGQGQLFLSEDGLSGIMVKPDGDVVSVFSTPGAPKGRAYAMLMLAIQQGGWKLDCFDTQLPHIYSRMGFVAKSRMNFNDEFAPPGWDRELYAEFNEGRPDLVMMRLVPEEAHPYQIGDGPKFDDYDAAVAAQVGTETLDQSVFHGTLEQTGGDGPRAQIALKEREAFVALMGANDLSSFNHELAHWFLQQMVVLRQLGLATDQMQRDLDTIVAWTGAENWQSLTRPLADREFAGKPDKPHEIFARGWEVFLAEGRVPRAELEDIFFRFRGWVRQVYGGILGAKAKLGVELDDEIRRVYDRLFLIESALEEAGGDATRPLLEAKPDDWTDAQWTSYQRAWAKAQNRALTQVTRRHIPAAMRRQREQRAQAIDVFRAEAEARVANDPGWAAIAFLKRDENALGLDREGLRQVLGPDATGLIEALLARPDQGQGRRLVAPEGQEGLDPEWVAEAFGFRTAGDLVEAILQARTVDQLVQERVNREIETSDEWSEEAVLADAEAAALADRENLALAELRYLREAIARGPALADARREQAATGAPAASDAASAEASARENLGLALDMGLDEQQIADLQARQLAAEAQSTAARQGRTEARIAQRALRAIEVKLTAGALRHRARLLVAEVKTGELRRERKGWLAAGSKAAKAARKLVAARQFGEAAVHIERELLAFYAVEELNRIEREVESGWRLIDRLKKGKALDKLRAPGFDGAAQIAQLFLRYDLRRARPGRGDPPPALARKLQRAIEQSAKEAGVESLSQFVSRMEDERAEVLVVPDWLLNETQPRHWKDMPLVEFLGLVDTIRNIEHVSKQEVTDIRTKEKVRLEDAAQSIARRVTEASGLRKKGTANRPNPLSVQAIRDMTSWADSMLLRISDWVDFAGGDDIDANTLRRYVLDPIVNGEFDYIEDMPNVAEPWMKALAKLDSGRMSRSIVIPELGNQINTLRYSEIFMMALHTGTESNLHRLYEGFANSRYHQWTPQGIDAALAHLTDAEWAVVQEIWDAFEGLRERSFEHHFQMTGQRPVLLVPREFVSPTGRAMKGGYMPAKYDGKYSERARALNEKADINGMFGHSFTKTDVEHGHLKSRVQNYSAPLDLDIAVVPRHLDQVVYDIHMRKAVQDAYKLVHHPVVRHAIEDAWGRPYLDALEQMVHNAGRKRDPRAKNWKNAEKVNNFLRSGVVYAGLGYRLSTGFLQVSGWVPILGEVGTTWTLAATTRFVTLGGWGLVRRVRESSVVLRNRGLTRDRELRQFVETLQGKNSIKAKIDANMGIFIVIGDAIVSSIAWDAQRMKSMHEHGDMKRAIREADRAIVRTQGSSTVGEMSALMRAEGAWKWLTLFGSFMSNVYARERRAVRLALGQQATRDVDGKPERKVRPAAATWLLLTSTFFPALIDAIIRGQGPDDDDKERGPAGFLDWALRNWASFLSAPVPLIGQLIDQSLHPERSFGSASPALRVFEPPVAVVKDAMAIFDEDEEFDMERLTRDVMLGLTMAKVAPLSQVEIWVDNFWAGEELGSPRDLIWRKPRERRE